ncbi:uncharacterized protein LOC119736607 [Patiria miniata]|uniref:Ig-like domain-containing protein n=1 Tax=Patiria miniata TaxID=46514 RepID=A0A914AT73_PATMI|nr:uncharacterized protein LOC119736607 [Patiria miniata]
MPYPLSKSCNMLVEEVDAMYWYYDSIINTALLISYFNGRVAPQNGIPEGVYDIDSECNLIIENVTASNQGTYYYKLKPHLLGMEVGQIEVCDKVSPRRSYPTVIGCNQDHEVDTCEARVRHDRTMHNLTCVMEQVKPAVQLKWFLGGLTELKASSAVRPVVLPANTGLWLRNNTYSTSATIQVPSDYNDIEYVCEAMGVAVLGSSTTRTRVRLTKTKPTTATHDGALLLERGHRGIVPGPNSLACKLMVEDVDAMYWFYGSLSDTFMLISYFNGRVAPQNGIPEGVYDIDDECNLIIENVTAPNEGTYFYKLKPHLKSTTEGQIEVRDKVSPSRPYPTVIGCNQDHDADTCEVRVRQDRTMHNLTCVMEQVKPAVELKWFLGGLTELKASTIVRPVVLPANIENVDAMYWYYGSISETSLLISYFLGRVAPKNGIPEGVYDIDNEFSLVIENVTAYNEGTYYYKLKARFRMIEEGQVEVYDRAMGALYRRNIIGFKP